MRIAIILQPWDSVRLPFEGGSSIAILGYRFAEQLAKSHDVTIFCGGGSASGDTASTGRLTVRSLPAPRKLLYKLADRVTGIFEMTPALMTRQRYFGEYFAAVAAELESDSFDVVHVKTFFQFLPRFRQACPEAAIVLHMSGETASMAPRDVVEPVLSEVDLFLGCSGFIVGAMKRQHPGIADRCAVLWNGIDRSPVDTAHPSPDDERILFVGRISPEKGIHILLEAFNRIAVERPNARLDLIGGAGLLPYSYHVGHSTDPADKKLLRYYGRSLVDKVRRQILNNSSSYMHELRKVVAPEAESRVHFHGPMLHSKLKSKFRSAAIFAFPSAWHEPFGMPVAEAMAAGIPVVGTRSGGIPEIIADGATGLLVPRGDAGALADTLVELLGDADRRQQLGEAGRKRARKHFAWEVLGNRLLGLYEKALATRQGTVKLAG